MVILDAKRFFPVGSNIGTVPIADAQASMIGKLCQGQLNNDNDNTGRVVGMLDSITILDMDGTEEPELLMNTMEGLLDLGLLATLPVAALVTPGTSSSLIMDWILYGDWTMLSEQRVAEHWILISAGAAVLPALGDDPSTTTSTTVTDKAPIARDALQDNISSIDMVNEEDDWYHRHDPQQQQQQHSYHPLRVMDHWPTLAIHCSSGDELSMRAGQVLQQQASRVAVQSIPGVGPECVVHQHGSAAAADLIMEYLRRAEQDRMLRTAEEY